MLTNSMYRRIIIKIFPSFSYSTSSISLNFVDRLMFNESSTQRVIRCVRVCIAVDTKLSYAFIMRRNISTFSDICFLYDQVFDN